MLRHLQDTINDSVHHYQTETGNDLKFFPPNILHKENRQVELPLSSLYSPHAFVCSNWEINILNRRSVGGNAIFLIGEPIEYYRLKCTVVLSCSESKLYAACNVAKNVKCFRSTFSHFRFKQPNPATIYLSKFSTMKRLPSAFAMLISTT